MKFIATKAVQVQYKHTIYTYTKEIKILEIKKNYRRNEKNDSGPWGQMSHTFSRSDADKL